MKITACSIVKNEARNIARSIESYKNAVDEIIIVDTGSTDKTVEICKSLGINPLFYKWDNDFSSAKNYAIDHAKGDWIIFLDADEWFVPNLKRTLIDQILDQIGSKVDGIILTMKQIDIGTNNIFTTEVAIRIFKNLPEIRYKGNIHERIMNGNNELTLARCPDLQVYHSGYSRELLGKKAERNLSLLYEAYNSGKKNTILLFFLLRENFSARNYDEAVKFHNLLRQQEDLDFIINKYSIIISFYEYAYGIMKHRTDIFSYADIGSLLKEAYSKYPELPIHSYLLGREAMATDFGESEKWLTRAIDLNKNYTGRYINTFSVHENDAYYRLGVINKQKGRADQALEYFVKSLRNCSKEILFKALQSIIDIIGKQPEEEIILFLNSILDLKDKVVLEVLLSLLKQTRLHKTFIYYAIKYNKEFDGQDETTYIAMILMGQEELVVETAISASKFCNHELLENKCQESEVSDNKDLPNEIISYFTDNYEDINTRQDINVNWQFDYATIAILHSKKNELFTEYRKFFNSTQSKIMEAYFDNKKIGNVSEDIYVEIKKLLNISNFIFEKDDLSKLSSLLTDEIF